MVRLGFVCGLLAALSSAVQGYRDTEAFELTPRGGGKKVCPPLNRGGFVVNYFQLYPENADWDEENCLLWIGCLWNATVGIYDPYRDRMLDVLFFPGISLTLAHIGGVARDPYSGLISILSNSGNPWATGGADVTGERQLMKYDPKKKKVLWARNMTDISRDRYGGFQDVEHDKRGNTYIVGTYPGVIIRVDKNGRKLTEWYLHRPLSPTTRKGYSGLAVVKGTDIMLASDGDGKLYRFDLREERGRPVNVPLLGEDLHLNLDAIYLPPKYGGSVLLVADLFEGIQVLRSRDRTWRKAENLGTISKPPTLNGLVIDGAVVAPVQMGSNSLYMVIGNIDPFIPGMVAGNRTLFPFPDITNAVEGLLSRG